MSNPCWKQNSYNPFETFKALNKDSFIEARYKGPLYGRVRVAGAKNMVTKVIAASLSSEEGTVKIKNIPLIGELLVTLSLCKRLGIPYRVNPDKSLDLRVGHFKNPDVTFDPYFANRVSILFAGPVLSKLGEAKISKPSGCSIGERKVNFHLRGLELLGVDVEDKGDHYYFKLKGNSLKGAEINLPFPSVGATENLIIAASCARGTTIIKNAAIEPEIVQMVEILQRSGVPIEMPRERVFVVHGRPRKIITTIEIIPDRIEVFSWAVTALATKGDIFVEGARQDHMITPISVLQKAGAGVEVVNNGIRFYYQGALKPLNIDTQVYPGFPTDMQQPLCLLLSQCSGQSSIHETIFENRFKYLDRLRKITPKGSFSAEDNCPSGNTCRFEGKKFPHLAKIKGPVEFEGGDLLIDDLRAGFAMLIAAILCKKKIRIHDLKPLYRGYEAPVEKLLSLGADIRLSL